MWKDFLRKNVTGLALACCVLAGGLDAVGGQPLDVKVGRLGSYQVYLPVMGEGKKPALVIWLHPAGAEANQLIVKWWPELHDLGYGLMLPKSTTPRHWKVDDVKLILGYLDHAIQTHGVDGRRVVLFGFSAGGGFAYYLGMKHGERLAGIVTLSALPVRSARDLAAPVPPAKLKDSLFYFLAVGDQEPGAARIARDGQLAFVAEGFSAVLHVAKKEGHQFHESQKNNVLAWLKQVAAGRRPQPNVSREDVAAFKERRDRRRELHRTRTATAIKIFDTIEQHLGKPYKLKWTAAAELDQGGKLTVAMPEGWKLGEKATNGDSAVVRLVPPGKQHIVAVLGRSVKQEGVGAHYQNWFADMARSNHMTLGKHGKLRANGRDWYVYAAFMVPHKKQHDPLARRLLVLALHPLNGAGTEWRSLTVMCPEQNCADNHIAEIIRGILEKLEFEPAAKKGG